MLTADEHRGHFTRRITNRFNESSLSGAGAVPTEVRSKRTSTCLLALFCVAAAAVARLL